MVATSVGPCARCEDPGSAGLYRCPTVEGKVCWKCLRREMGDTNGSVQEPRHLDELSVGRNGTGRDGSAASSLVSFDQIVAVPVKWLWHDRVALSKITGLAGRPKIGKGLVYSRLIADVTHGTLAGDVREPRDAIIVTTEDDPGDTLKPRLMAVAADLRRVHFFQMGNQEEPVPFRIPQDVEELSRRIHQTNAALVVVDPLIEFIDGKTDAHKSQPVRQALAALNGLARQTIVAIVVIIHLNKGASTDPLIRHEGSAAFTQVLRGAMLLGHDPNDPKGERGSRRVLAVSSSNLAQLAPSLLHEIRTATVRGHTGEEIVTAEITCVGESDATGSDLLGSHDNKKEPSALDDAVDFLLTELADGPRPSVDVKETAADAGISEKTLYRAKNKLEIRVSKAGYQGAWSWSLNGASKDGQAELATFEDQADGHLWKHPVDTGDPGSHASKDGQPRESDHLGTETGKSETFRAHNNGGEEMVF